MLYHHLGISSFGEEGRFQQATAYGQAGRSKNKVMFIKIEIVELYTIFWEAIFVFSRAALTLYLVFDNQSFKLSSS